VLVNALKSTFWNAFKCFLEYDYSLAPIAIEDIIATLPERVVLSGGFLLAMLVDPTKLLKQIDGTIPKSPVEYVTLDVDFFTYPPNITDEQEYDAWFLQLFVFLSAIYDCGGMTIETNNEHIACKFREGANDRPHGLCDGRVTVNPILCRYDTFDMIQLT